MEPNSIYPHPFLSPKFWDVEWKQLPLTPLGLSLKFGPNLLPIFTEARLPKVLESSSPCGVGTCNSEIIYFYKLLSTWFRGPHLLLKYVYDTPWRRNSNSIRFKLVYGFLILVLLVFPKSKCTLNCLWSLKPPYFLI